MTKKIKISSQFITLGQLLKLTGEISNGGQVKIFLEEEKIQVNNELENRRGRKLYKNDEILVNKKKYIIE